MEDKVKEELEELIKEGETFCQNFTKQENMFIYYTLSDGVEQSYKDWLESIRLWTKNNYHSEFNVIDKIVSRINTNKTPSLHDSVLSKLRSMLKHPQKKRPTMNDNNKRNAGVNIYNTLSQEQKQEQSQSQKLLQEIFIEAIKDDLTGKQQKELRAILDEHKEDVEKAKPKLVNKILSFGKDVASNILANILTNPNILGHF